jgi:hypothetical protein
MWLHGGMFAMGNFLEHLNNHLVYMEDSVVRKSTLLLALVKIQDIYVYIEYFLVGPVSSHKLLMTD